MKKLLFLIMAAELVVSFPVYSAESGRSYPPRSAESGRSRRSGNFRSRKPKPAEPPQELVNDANLRRDSFSSPNGNVKYCEFLENGDKEGPMSLVLLMHGLSNSGDAAVQTVVAADVGELHDAAHEDAVPEPCGRELAGDPGGVFAVGVVPGGEQRRPVGVTETLFLIQAVDPDLVFASFRVHVVSRALPRPFRPDSPEKETAAIPRRTRRTWTDDSRGGVRIRFTRTSPVRHFGLPPQIDFGVRGICCVFW